MENQKKLLSLIDSYFEGSECRLIETVIRGSGSTVVLEVFVDRQNEGVHLDELSKISKDLNEIVDSDDEFRNISSLIVSSPGADRPVKHAWQLVKHKGRTLELEYINGEKTEAKLTDVIEKDGGTLMLEFPGGKGGGKSVSEHRFEEFKNVKVKISFSKK